MVVVEQRRRVEPVEAATAHDVLDDADAIRPDDLARGGIPHEQMMVVGIEAIEVERLARALPDRAERQFTLSADLVEHMRQTFGFGGVDDVLLGLEQSALGWQALDLGDERLDRFRRRDLGHGRRDRGRRGPRGPECEGAFAQIGHERGVVRLRAQCRRGDRLAHGESQRVPELVEELARQTQRAQHGMHEAEHLEPGAVASREVHRQHRRAGAAHETRERRSPRRFLDTAPTAMQVRDLARGEQHEHAALLEPAMRGAHAGDVALLRARAAERIDGDVERTHLGDLIEQEVPEEADVLADRREQRHERDALDHPERMIGDHDARPGRGDARPVGLGAVERDAAHVERHREQVLGRLPRRDRGVERVDPRDAEQVLRGAQAEPGDRTRTGHEPGKVDHRGLVRARRRHPDLSARRPPSRRPHPRTWRGGRGETAGDGRQG